MNIQHPCYTEAYSIAIVCHEANRAWCFVNGDETQKAWGDAEEWQRESAVDGVLFKIDNPGGEIKDAIKKTHPCLVPFESLPNFQQKKDALFCAIVEALRAKVTA